MKFIFFIILCCHFKNLQAQQSQQKWNRQMQLKSCSIRIDAGQFTASTFIEMDFYNPNEQELEGLHQFTLMPGQVITAFQLELNGKYRDGTLEEKWKATSAYNRIVGKRIDPALLTMDYKDHYSLRIYPVPAKGSRKITFTIQQLLTIENGALQYSLPFNISDTVNSFHLSITSVVREASPTSNPGIISDRLFKSSGDEYKLQVDAENITLKTAVSFAIPLLKTPVVCTETAGKKMFFATRFQSKADSTYEINPIALTVFWDASASAENRNINLEIGFLQQFISYHHIRTITIVPFNYKLLDTAVFNFTNGNDNRWKQYLHNIVYDGATQLGCINLDKGDAALCMVYTDGRNTYGKKSPATNGSILYCINSSCNADIQALNQMVGASGGRVIDLTKTTINKAVDISSKAENWLLKISSSRGKIAINQQLPVKLNQSILISGTSPNETDTLFFHYGNSNAAVSMEQIILPVKTDCNEPLISRINMLQQFDKTIIGYNWEKTLDFGLDENVVTPNTAYIVLERIEDYIKYNIEAPKELQEECKLLQYVKSNTRGYRQQIKQQDEFDILTGVLKVYNERVKKLKADDAVIKITRKDLDSLPQPGTSVAADEQKQNIETTLAGKSAGIDISNKLDEVVVIGYGTTRKSNLTGAVIYIQRNEIANATSVEQALQGRVAGLTVTQNSGAPGSAANIMIRGSRSFNGNNEPLFVVDGIPVMGNINDIVNVNDIESITVLKDGQAGAFYGPRAVNGAIVISTKRGRNNYYHHNYYSNKPYRLKDMEDVEYMQEIEAVPAKEKPLVYKQLVAAYGTEGGFYFDMAQHFFDAGLKQDAFKILMNAAEKTNGSIAAQLAIAYVLEGWNMFEEASVVYTQLAANDSSNIVLRRDLAWACYQQGNYQRAVDILYEAIKQNMEGDGNKHSSVKATMLYEMNAIIMAHKDKVNTSLIPATMIKILPSDLRIVIDFNKHEGASMKVKEPGGISISGTDTFSQSGAIIYGNNLRYYGECSPLVYQQRHATNGKYKLFIRYYPYYYQEPNIPSIARIKTFKNFGKPNQSIEIKNVMMDNQYGEIEIGTVTFGEVKK
ncbi:MAG: TonB-dependent receptor plug domain-containing protein [Ferruginibacter sp.]